MVLGIYSRKGLVRTSILVLTSFLFLVVILLVNGAESVNPEDEREIGFEFLNSIGGIVDESEAETIHVWNTKDNYYFNKSSGTQLTNIYQDYWTHNTFCLSYKNSSNDLDYKCNDEFSFNWDIKSDNLTYVNYTGWKDIEIEDKEVRATIRYHLKPEDNNITIQVSIENIGEFDITTNVGFLWKSDNIQINGEGDDYIEINGTSYLLNQTLDKTYTYLDNAGYNLLDKTGSKLWLKWDENLDYTFIVNSTVGQYNAPITLDINFGSLDIWEEKNTEMFWHDADFWTYNITIFDITDSSDPSEDVFVADCEITVEEGSTGTYCGGASLANLEKGNIYFLRIKGNTTEADYNYDADAQSETTIKAPTIWNWNSAGTFPKYVVQTSYVPDDNEDTEGGTCAPFSSFNIGFDVMFWSTIFDGSITETVADSINYSVDANTYESFYGCSDGVDFQFTESTSGDTDPENGGFTGWDSQSMTSGEFYYWGVIFSPNNEFTSGTVENLTFHQSGEGGDLDQEINWNWTIVEAPTVSISYPVNDSWLNNNVSINLNFTYTNATALDTCLFTTDDYATNTTITNCANTTFNRSEGNYLLKLWINDSNGIIAEDSTNFTIDITYPNINITFPLNNTNSSNTGLNINYTVSDTNLQACWYSNDSMSSNTTLASCGTNITTITWTEGQHNVTIWANDSANNINSSRVSFTIDITPPNITIDEPQDTDSYAVNEDLALNYTTTDILTGVNTCWYNIINSTGDMMNLSGGNDVYTDNTTLTDCLNVTFNLSRDDTYVLTLWANDSLNNINYSNSTFSISTTSPAINLDYPTDNSHLNNGTNVYFNFTATDSDNLDTCELWGNWTGTWHNNYTWVQPNSGVMNWTTQNITEGAWKWNVWCNDTLNNENFALINYTITIDETNPKVNFITANDTTVTGLSIDIFYNVTDTNIDKCYFTLRSSGGLVHNYAENTSTTCGDTSRSISTLGYGTFTFQLWGEDLAGNLNQSILTFTTQATGTPPGGGGGTPEPDDDEDKSFCGDNICQKEGNDFGLVENYWNCQVDCVGGGALDDLFSALFSNCFDDDPNTLCFWIQGFGIEEIESSEVVMVEKINIETLLTNCLDDDKFSPCFWNTSMAVYLLFGGFGLFLALSTIKIKAPGERRKVSTIQYIKIKLKKRKRRR